MRQAISLPGNDNAGRIAWLASGYRKKSAEALTTCLS
jgi:hypothetical protein